MKKIKLPAAFLPFALITASGCSTLWSAEDRAETVSPRSFAEEQIPAASQPMGRLNETVEVPRTVATAPTNIPRPSNPAVKTASVELVWRAPSQAVEKYHIQYGYAVDKLDGELVVPITSLEKFDHPQYGPLFRYVLNNIPKGQKLFVTLRAENAAGTSDPAQPMEILTN